MPQCKLSNCREQAVDGPWRKRYCKAHGKAYLAKRKEYLAQQALLTDCDECGGKVQASRTAADLRICQACQDDADAAAKVQAEYWSKVSQWENADTVHDLKEWFQEWRPEIFEGGR